VPCTSRRMTHCVICFYSSAGAGVASRANSSIAPMKARLCAARDQAVDQYVYRFHAQR
jgi:hypothetical protein